MHHTTFISFFNLDYNDKNNDTINSRKLYVLHINKL